MVISGTSASAPNTIRTGTNSETAFSKPDRLFDQSLDSSTTSTSDTKLPSGSTGSPLLKNVDSGKSFADSIRLARNHSRKAMELAKQLVEACESGEFMEQFRLGTELDYQLKLMWKHRKGRDDMWWKLLNFLQSALKSVDYDGFVVEQAIAVLRVTEMLAGSHVDRDDIRSAKRLLADARLDHWFGISEPSSNKSST